MSKRKRVTAKLIIAPNPILTQVCEPVEDGEDVSGIIRDMMHILVNSKHGVGLAAPQAGHLKRIIIVCRTPMINPSFRKLRSGIITADESCLSYPGKSKAIERYGSIGVTYRRDTGELVEEERWDNFLARIIQHEIDHLDGKCKVGERN
jgi:peptide deformylase